MLGFTLKVPHTDRVLNHIYWRDDPLPAQWQPVPTWFERLARAGVGARAVLPAAFVGSGLTDAVYRGARIRPITRDADYGEQLSDEIGAAPGLIYSYTAALDTAAHLSGIGSPQWHAAATYVDTLLRRLVESLPADAALLVTADHGGVNVAPEARVDLDTDPRLAAGVRVVAGDPRVRYLYTEPGPRPMCWRPEANCWPGGPRYTAVTTPWRPGCSARYARNTCPDSATSSSSAPARRRCWPPPTSRPRWPA
ncbi:type I phosphodiesterase / nucleotide pyrophosphatase family protein [Mycobacterium xenopi 3993]|nr:type I phosphodiesterase / nucleotide pyrophosphatase family protein [Mycobacterium xenopi 3993]